MKKYLLILASALSITACSSIDLPTIEESEKNISACETKIEASERAISEKKISFPSGNELIMKMTLASMNKIFDKLAWSNNEDMYIDFPPTRPLMSEKKNVLSIEYTNFLNIDSGYVAMNLKSLHVDSFDKNTMNARLEIEGRGFLKVSGKYTGVPASVSPEIQLYMNEQVSFELVPDKDGNITLKPKPKKLNLKTKFFVKLIAWNIPWSQDIPLELTNLVKPISLPANLSSDIKFPLPAETFGKDKLQYVPYSLVLSNTRINADKNSLEFRTDVDFKKK